MATADIPMLLGISQELNDTLILMNHSLERLEHTYPELQCYQYWQDTKETYLYMKALAAKLRIWQQSIGCNRTPVDFEQLLHSLYLTCASLPEAGSKRIIYCCHRNIPIIYAARKQLKAALFSLLCCRLNQCPPNTCLRMDLNPTEECIVLRITDEGSPEMNHAKMNICIRQMTNMAVQHGGSFRHQASDRGGCICTLTLPLQPKANEL